MNWSHSWFRLFVYPNDNLGKLEKCDYDEMIVETGRGMGLYGLEWDGKTCNDMVRE